MSYETITEGGSLIKTWTQGVPFDDNAKKQVANIASMPFIHKWVSVMPDVHLGRGATIGSVIATVGAVIPAAVGVDLGCGLNAVKTNLTANDLPDNLFAIRSAIERAIPHGRTNDGGRGDRGSWNNIPEDVLKAWGSLDITFNSLVKKHSVLKKVNSINHLGTLGTGNHFIEICLDENDDVWIMLHSGSRGVGNRIGSYFIELAKKDMEKWFINLPDKDLAYLPQGTDHFKDYVEAVNWAQDFASVNRRVMMSRVIAELEKELKNIFVIETSISCHHNYIAWENHYNKNVLVTRKGAVRARETDLGIIPGSMGAKSFIVQGKGNKDSFCSCSHGAGRVMSRTEAKRRVTLAQHVIDTKGVECRKDETVIDETPSAYKNIEDVMKAQDDLVEIKYTLKQVVCVKG